MKSHEEQFTTKLWVTLHLVYLYNRYCHPCEKPTTHPVSPYDIYGAAWNG